MKTKIKIILPLALGCLLYVACKKEVVLEEKDIENPVNSSILTNKYSISVHNGRIKFSSFEEYFRITNLDQEQKKDFYTHIKKFANFNSAAEASRLKGGNKSATACDCEIDDEYINEIVDSHYMVEIENFTVKLNGCTRMVYVSDNLAANATARESALVNCDFNRSDYYVYTFNHVVEEELPIIRDSLNGINVAGRRCTEVAISDRASALISSGSTTVNGTTYTWPNYELVYNNNGLNGTLRAQTSIVTNVLDWKFRFSHKHFRRRCASTTNSPNSLDAGFVPGGANKMVYTLSSGTRLTNAPSGTQYKVRFRLERASPFVQSTSGDAEIIP